MTEPTFQDRENYAARKIIADRERVEYAQVEAFALSLFGPGWIPHGKHKLVTHAEAARHRATGEPIVPDAVIISVRKGDQERHFTVEDGTARESPRWQEAWAERLKETDGTFEHKGQQVPKGKYEIHWGWFEGGYTPRTAEQLAAAREKRETKSEEKWQREVDDAANSSLFPEYVREQAEEQKKGRKR